MRIQYINANIHNRNETQFIVNDDKFESFGILDDSIKIIDLKNSYILPGFFDSHLHLVGLGYNKNLSNLVNKDVSEIVSTLMKNNSKWVIGRGWHQNNFSSSFTKADLDKVSLDRPVIAIRVCGHVLIANTKAIELTGITDNQYKGGTINFETGEFTEDALDVIYSLIPENNKDSIKEMILSAQSDLLAQGITSVGSDDFSMQKVNYKDVIDAYYELVDESKLKIRVVQQVNLPNKEDFLDFIDCEYPNKEFGNIKMGPMKLLLDGSLGGKTAYMNEPYEGTHNRGINTFTQSELNEMISLCESADMDFAIHAIGDAAVDMILSAPKVKRNHGIIHAQFLNKRQILECVKQNIVIYAQPIFLNSDIPIIEELVGKRYAESYLFKSMVNRGLSVSFSTDAPVEDINPFENIEVSMTRQMLSGGKPFLINEAFTFNEAINAYTEESHKQVNVENNGKLESGYKADFIVVDLSNYLPNSKVLETYIDGIKVY